jgi:hypothetical protein
MVGHLPDIPTVTRLLQEVEADRELHDLLLDVVLLYAMEEAHGEVEDR